MRRLAVFLVLVVGLGPFAALCAFAQDRVAPLQLYIDADYSIDLEAARAIELGVRTALAEVENTLGGLPVEVIPRDHRANTKRSHATMREYTQNPQALAIFGGKHSPPYLRHRDYINRNGVLMLLPWSAAGPVTRAQHGDENWVFRLSIDDSKAGGYLVRRAVVDGACNHTALLLLDSGWGRANRATMTTAFSDLGLRPAAALFFDTTIGEAGARAIARQVADAGADCAILLAGGPDGAYLSNALDKAAPGIRLFSHWGILSKSYPRMVDPMVRARLKVRVLQTCGLKVEAEGSRVLTRALALASARHVPIDDLSDLPAPAGFVHGYDMTRIVVAAAAQAAQSPEWGGTITAKRRALRHALQHLDTPVEGVLGPYLRPFLPYSVAEPDAHEALGREDLCMTAFRDDGRLRHVAQ